MAPSTHPRLILCTAVGISLFATLASFAGPAEPAGKESKAVEPPQQPDPWRFSLAAPMWTFWQVGDMGINGTTARVRTSPRDNIPKLDMALDLRAEAHKGRFGIMAEYCYLNISDGIGVAGLVKKLDVRTDQHQGELALSWRVIENDRGYLDVFGGVRYTNLYQYLAVHANSGNIDDSSQRFVDDVTDRVVDAIRDKLKDRIVADLVTLRNRDPKLPQGPIGEGVREEIAARLRTVIARRQGELDGALRSGIQSRIDAAKSRLSKDLAKVLKENLNTRVSRTDDWWDPFVGLKGKYYLNASKSFYVTGRGDVGGFGVGADFVWQINAGIGWNWTPNMYTDVTYRFLDVDYRHGGLVNDTLTHGIELTTGITF